MTERKITTKNTDSLLREYLKDDLPKETEARMIEVLEQFTGESNRRRMWARQAQRTRSIRSTGIGYDRMLSRAAFTAAAIVLLFVGIYMQTSGSRNALAESISSLGTYALVKDNIRNTDIVECTLRMTDSDGTHIQYDIQWIGPFERSIILRTDDLLRKTIDIHEDGILITDAQNGEVREIEDLDQLEIPHLGIIRTFLSPDTLEEALTANWSVEEYQEQAECDRGIYKLTETKQGGFQLVTVDLCTYLPTEIIRINSGSALTGNRDEIEFSVRIRWEISEPKRDTNRDILEYNTGGDR
ncbi:hypothetical protein ACFLT9_00725 [Acidobacteriota bacterium]